MSCFARSSPKLRELSRSANALALTLMPGADFCCARAMKLSSPLESGLNENEPRKLATAAIIASATAPAAILYDRARFISLPVYSKFVARGARDLTRTAMPRHHDFWFP